MLRRHRSHHPANVCDGLTVCKGSASLSGHLVSTVKDNTDTHWLSWLMVEGKQKTAFVVFGPEGLPFLQGRH